MEKKLSGDLILDEKEKKYCAFLLSAGIYEKAIVRKIHKNKLSLAC